MKSLYDVCHMPNYIRYFCNIILIAGFTQLLSLIIILIMTPSEQGYEYSIYGMLPIYFWVIFFTVIVISICLIFSGIYYPRHPVYGLLMLILCYTIFLFLPYILGYTWFAGYGYDLFAHLSWVQTINLTGNIPKIFYPASHILLSTLNQFGVPLRFGVPFIQLCFSIFYTTLIYLLIKVLIDNSKMKFLALALSIPLLFSFLHFSWIPFFLGLSIIPLLLFSFQKVNITRNWVEFSFIILIVSAALIFYHPMVSIFIILTLVIIELGVYFWKHSDKEKHNKEYFSFRKKFWIHLIFTIILFFFWYFSFTQFTRYVSIVTRDLLDLGQGTSSIFERSTDIIQNANASIFIILERFIKLYGPFSLYIAVGIACLIFIGWNCKKKNVDPAEILFGGLFFFAIIFGFILTFGYYILAELVRTLSFAIVMATVLMGLVISNWFDKNIHSHKKLLMSIILIGIISFSAIFGLLNIYPSPWIGTASPSITQMESNGYNWFLENRDPDCHLYINEPSIYKYNLYAFTNNPIIKNKQFLPSSKLPSHFVFHNNTTISKPLIIPTGYVAIREYDFTYYYAIPENLRSQRAIFTDNDYNNLKNNMRTEKLYTNREFEVWQLS